MAARRRAGSPSPNTSCRLRVNKVDMLDMACLLSAAGAIWFGRITPCLNSEWATGFDCLLNIGVQGIEAAMGCSEPRRIVRLAAADLDVARGVNLGGPVQRGIEFTERADFGREPALAAQGGGKSMIISRGEVVGDPIRIR